MCFTDTLSFCRYIFWSKNDSPEMSATKICLYKTLKNQDFFLLGDRQSLRAIISILNVECPHRASDDDDVLIQSGN